MGSAEEGRLHLLLQSHASLQYGWGSDAILKGRGGGAMRLWITKASSKATHMVVTPGDPTVPK